ncbi:hypothetical protein [Noviherbaspirillum cavernae]|uniref:hypothetical protein n=1 Tax=Noviherbaspirillum cavernae TaxID=2320862 RepID=UPI0013145EBB|nr:hypothetical protein [Noviherbaspirillum cavernae]
MSDSGGLLFTDWGPEFLNWHYQGRKSKSAGEKKGKADPFHDYDGRRRVRWPMPAAGFAAAAAKKPFAGISRKRGRCR